ncbi:MAG: WXG100 family type VII secretion target [Lachnospiraceae bacterium]|nr:WXG100 family type VII secretion target [Lachnospiraceae bacterium]
MSIKIDTGKVRMAADEISKLNRNISEDFSPLQRVVNSLSQTWTGRASEIATNKFRSIRNTYYDNRYYVIDDMVNFMHNQIGGGYENTENQIVNVAEKFR